MMTHEDVVTRRDTSDIFDDPVLLRVRAALDVLYGEHIDRVLLFGSRARGDGHAASDYDIAVFLKSMPDPWAERSRLADLRVDFIDEMGAFVDAKPFSAAAYFDQTPIMHEVRRDGREL